MAVTPKKLIASQQLTNSNATYYTATNCYAIIDKFTLVNVNTTAVTVIVGIVDSGGSMGTTERLISERSLAYGESYTCPEVVGHILNPGDSIQASANVGAVVTVRASGREVTGI